MLTEEPLFQYTFALVPGGGDSNMEQKGMLI